MKRRTLALLLAAAVSLASVSVSSAKDDFASSALGKELIDLGLKFLDNPGDFFFNLHSDNEDFSPLPDSAHGAVRFNFFPTFFPTTWANLNLKVKVLGEHGPWPQIDLMGMYGDLIALRALSSGGGEGGESNEVKPAFSDYTAGIILTKAANDTTRIFGGFKYSAVSMDVRFSTPVAAGSFEMSALDFQVADTVLVTGISHRTSETRNVIAQIGYGFKYRKIVSRLMLQYPHLELGMDIFPEGLFVFHPFMAWHWYF